MKDILAHLAFYLLCAVACVTAVVLVLLVMGSSLRTIVPLASTIVVAGWAGGMVPATLRVLRTAKRPILTATGAACLTAVVVVAVVVLSGSSRDTIDDVQRASSLPVNTVQPGRVYQGQEHSVVIDRVAGAELGPVVVADHMEGIDTRLQVYSEGYWDQADNQLILPGGPDIDLDTLKGFGVPEMPAAVRSTAADVLDFWATAVVLWHGPIPFVDAQWGPPFLSAIVSPVITVLLITLLLIVVWTPLRLTRWPLLNLAVAVAYLRGVVALPTALRRVMRIDRVGRAIPDVTLAEWIVVAGFLVFLGVAVVALILPSVSHWRHTMHFEERQS